MFSAERAFTAVLAGVLSVVVVGVLEAVAP